MRESPQTVGTPAVCKVPYAHGKYATCAATDADLIHKRSAVVGLESAKRYGGGGECYGGSNRCCS